MQISTIAYLQISCQVVPSSGDTPLDINPPVDIAEFDSQFYQDLATWGPLVESECLQELNINIKPEPATSPPALQLPLYHQPSPVPSMIHSPMSSYSEPAIPSPTPCFMGTPPPLHPIQHVESMKQNNSVMGCLLNDIQATSRRLKIQLGKNLKFDSIKFAVSNVYLIRFVREFRNLFLGYGIAFFYLRRGGIIKKSH